MRRALRRLLGSHGHVVELFENGQAFLNAQSARRFDCILLDLHMPGMNGFDVLRSLSGFASRPPVIVITGQDQPGNGERTTELGACAYLLKPVEEAPLLDAIEHCMAGEPGGRPQDTLNEGAIPNPLPPEE